jgi:chromosomal replication initiator protein
MACLEDAGQTLRIGLPDSFSLNWVSDHYRHVLEEEVAAFGDPVELQLELRPGAPEAGPESRKVELSQATAPRRASLERGASSRDDARSAPRVNPRYTFQSFVVGPSNELAWAAARSVVDSEIPTYSPLVIVGGVGLGKTHLMHAIAHELMKRRPNLKIHLRTSEQFITDVVQGIRMNKMDEVRWAYRACDVLLLDDIQFISGKETCQEEFFHTFNALYDAQKPIVVTSDRLPHEISDIQERVRSRFTWGLIADLKVPELETRAAILKRKATTDGIALDDDVAMFLAQSIRSNVRELEGCLVRVHAYSSLTRRELTLSLAREVLKDIVSDKGRALTCDVIVRAVSAHFDVKVSDLKSARRSRLIAFPRQIAMYLCRRHTGASYPEIGQALGGKDHTTALNAFNKIGQRLSDPDVRSHVEEIERVLLD